jgi:DNA-binding response OmpR family regulator
MKRILVVDDEKGLVKNLAIFLADEGFDVMTAFNGKMALEIFEKEQIDLCIVDMRLPDIDGNDVIRRAVKAGFRGGFIIYTGSAGYRLPHDLRELGISDENVFVKPVRDCTVISSRIVEMLEVD